MLLSTSILIELSPEVVRSTLLDLPLHSKWNPFFTRFEVVGDDKTIQEGTKFSIDMVLPGETSKNTFTPTCLTSTRGELSWKGLLLADFVFAGVHKFEFRPVEQGTELVQSETFSGVLVPVLRMIGLFDKTQSAFELLNAALKAEAEARST